MKKLLSMLMIISILFTLAPTQTAEAAIKLNKTSITLETGNTETLKITGTTKKASWSSSKKSVATVSSKGVVTAKSAGSATITAKLSGKKYSCKVNVKESFNAKDALKNIKTTETVTDKGIIVQLKNNYLYPVRIEAVAVYYDENGTMIGKSNDNNYYFDKDNECVLSFTRPYDSNYKDVEFESYKINYSISSVSKYSKSNVKDIKISDNFGAENVMVEVTNSGKDKCLFTKIVIIFYKEGKVIYSDYQYADVNNPEDVDYLQFSFPYDENYNTIKPDDYKVYVNSSYN